MTIFSLGVCGGRSAPSVNSGPPDISEIDIKLKFCTLLDRTSTLFRYENFSARGRTGVAAPPSVNFGSPYISQTITDRQLKFYIPLDTAKYSFQI